MHDYELAVLLHPDLEIDVDKPIKKLEGLIKKAEGKITNRDNWGKRRLAYTVAGQDFAVYVFWQLSLPPARVAELERNLKIMDEILRHLLVAVTPTPPTAGKAVASSGAKSKATKPTSKVDEKGEAQ